MPIARWFTHALVVTLLAAAPLYAKPAEAPAPKGDTAKPADQAKSTDDADQGSVVGWLELGGTLRDGPIPFAWLGSGDVEPSLRDVLGQLETVEEGDQYKGVVVYLDRPELSMSQAMALADAMKKISDAGKEVVTFAEQYDMRAYLLAAAADLVVLQRNGSVELNGLSVEEMYLAGLLEKIGVKADMVQVGKYKGADEQMTRTGPSKEWSQNMDRLLDDLYAQITDRVADGRNMSKDEVEQAIADSWTLDDDALIKRRIIDRVSDRDLVSVTGLEFGEDFSWDDSMGRTTMTSPGASNPFGFFQMLFQKREVQTTRPTIAIVHAAGPITSGDSSLDDGPLSSQSIGSRTMVRALGQAKDDSNIKGVLIRLDSPGGSALASEVIWQAVHELGEDKPVFASVGSMAASGGYYIACATDQIYTEPSSILGSIGVVGGKLVMGGLYDKLGIHVTRRSRGPMADMFNSVQPFTDAQREKVRKSMVQTYDQFKDRVKTGRGSRIQGDLQQLAAGRVFTGRQAVGKGLADKVAGEDKALEDLASQLKLKPGQFDVVYLPPPVSLKQYLDGLLGRSVRAPIRGASLPASAKAMLGAAKALMGPAAWDSASSAMSGMLLLQREPVLTLLPTAIVIR